MCPSGSRAVSQKVNFCGQGNTGASPRLPLGEERANILLLTCCYQEGSKVAAVQARWRLQNQPPPKPWLPVYLESVATGPWSASARRVYAGVGNVIEEPGAFHLGFDGHHLATSFVGFDFENGLSMVQGVDTPPDEPGREALVLLSRK